MSRSISLRTSAVIAILLVAASLVLVYVSRIFPALGAKTADACVLGAHSTDEVYFVSCGGFF